MKEFISKRMEHVVEKDYKIGINYSERQILNNSEFFLPSF